VADIKRKLVLWIGSACSLYCRASSWLTDLCSRRAWQSAWVGVRVSHLMYSFRCKSCEWEGGTTCQVEFIWLLDGGGGFNDRGSPAKSSPTHPRRGVIHKHAQCKLFAYEFIASVPQRKHVIVSV